MKYWIAGLIAAFLLSTKTARAEPFTGQNWSDGVHLLAGMGVNASYFESDLGSRSAGIGLNIHTSVGYFFLNNFAVEASTNVMFSRVKRILVWDTLQTLGMRIRVPPLWDLQNVEPYIRLLGGRGPSVLIYKGPKPDELEIEADRTQVEGDIYGLGYGVFQNAKGDSTWFLELVATAQFYRRIEAIVDKDSVPEVISSKRMGDHSVKYALSLTFGVVAF